MKKGDKRKEAILNVAEKMFYDKGYDATSVQDIIDALNLSKGGFYHHFASKEQLMEALCEKKVEADVLAATRSVQACTGDATQKLNALFEKNGVWKADNAAFIGLLMRVFYRDDNLIMREKMQRKLHARTLPLLQDILEEGMRQELFFTSHLDGIGRVILRLMNDLTDEIAAHLLSSNEERLGLILDSLSLYRSVVERLLDAPYGSIVLYEVETLEKICADVLKS